MLLALVDPEYKFIVDDVGSYGRDSDGSAVANSNIEKKANVIVGDETFPLISYSKKIFNCSFSRIK